MAGFESKGGNLPPSGGSPEKGPKVRVYELKDVKMGSGSLAERLVAGRREAGINNVIYVVDESIPRAREFKVKDTREIVDLRLIRFNKPMTSKEVVRWLEGRPEYQDFELARPEHLDALNSDHRLVAITLEEGMGMAIVALGASTTVRGVRNVVSLHVSKGGRDRELVLDMADHRWPRGWSTWFLLVRKAGN